MDEEIPNNLSLAKKTNTTFQIKTKEVFAVRKEILPFIACAFYMHKKHNF
jgi:hypothetical protein